LATRSGTVLKGRNAARPGEGKAVDRGSSRGSGGIHTVFNGWGAGNLVHHVVVEVEVVVVANVFVGRVDAIVSGDNVVLIVMVSKRVHVGGYRSFGVVRVEDGDVGTLISNKTVVGGIEAVAVSVGQTVLARGTQEVLGSLVGDFAKRLGLVRSEGMGMVVMKVVRVVDVWVSGSVCNCASASGRSQVGGAG
jgi:hypothetical protein